MPVYMAPVPPLAELEAELKALEARIDRVQKEVTLLRNPASADAFRLAAQLCAEQIRLMGCNCDGRQLPRVGGVDHFDDCPEAIANALEARHG